MRRPVLTLLPLLLLAACPSDEEATATDPETATTPGATYAATLEISDFLTRQALGEVPIDIEGSITVTNNQGVAALEVPGGTFEAKATLEAYLDTYWTFYNDDDGFSLGTFLVSDMAAGAVAGATGTTLDPTKAVVVVTVYDGGQSYTADATVTLDAASDLSLVGDNSSPVGFGVGDTTLAGSPGWVVFLNVDPGTVTPTIDTANGEICRYFPGSETSASFTAHANAINHVHVTCQ